MGGTSAAELWKAEATDHWSSHPGIWRRQQACDAVCRCQLGGHQGCITTGWSASRIRLKGAHRLSTKVRSDWQRAASHSRQLWEVPSICIWQRGRSGKRPQTARKHIQEATAPGSHEAAKDAAAASKIQHCSVIQARKADTLSRAYLHEQKENLMEEELQVNWMSEEKQERFRNATAQDPVLQKLKDIAMQGWPKDRSAVPQSAQPFLDIQRGDQFCLRSAIQIRQTHCATATESTDARQDTRVTLGSGQMQGKSQKCFLLARHVCPNWASCSTVCCLQWAQEQQSKRATDLTSTTG